LSLSKLHIFEPFKILKHQSQISKWPFVIKKEEEIEKEKSGVKEWTEEDDNEMGNMVDPYYKL